MHADGAAERERGTKRGRDEADQNDEEDVDIRTVSLGSRKQLCVNDKLRAKVTDIDEACRQMLGGVHVPSCTSNYCINVLFTEKGDRRCEYLPPADDEVRMMDFRDQVLVSSRLIVPLPVHSSR